MKDKFNNSKNNGTQKRILIANRGEIAIRIARAVKELGHIAIGLWTENEINAAHLEFCQEWVKLEGSSNSETYLNISQLVSIAKEYKIDAVHPGYGFLSENEDFAESLVSEKIIFIGPHSEAIKLMGDKARAKAVAREAGVPVVPGSKGEIQNLKEAFTVANEVKYPVLLKAVAGGGGRGMRLCNNEQELRANFETVKREAKAAFGYEGILVEKYILGPHHIEVQILADKKGNIFHFYERECSIQRRHQKILEESPSPFIGSDENLRAKICNEAVKLAKAVGYDSAGTVEFVMGEDKNFYFLEMNTRIQVEHPITEEITGIDLMVCMIQSALGEDLGIPSQGWIQRFGHAIECRICAEDPITMLPSPGLVMGFGVVFPQGVRFDHCLYKGLKVTPEFDPMVGKLVTKGINRSVAIRKMNAALDGLFIEGLKNNILLHKEILKNDNFLKGIYSTNFINEERPQDGIITETDMATLIEKLALIEAVTLGL